jgi:putative SOS response-associated peptidase YedK
MCGRFASTLPLEQLARLFGATGELTNIAPNWNTAPTQASAVLRRYPDAGERRLDLLRGGRRPGASGRQERLMASGFILWDVGGLAEERGFARLAVL